MTPSSPLTDLPLFQTLAEPPPAKPAPQEKQHAIPAPAPAVTPHPPPAPATPRPASPPVMTVAEIIADIQSWTDLPETRRTNFISAVRRTDRILIAAHLAPDLDDARPDAMTCVRLNKALFGRPPAMHGLTTRRFADIVGLTGKALVRLGIADEDETALTAQWVGFDALLPTKYRRMALAGFMRFCSAQAIPPAEAGPQALAAYEAWLATRTLCKDPAERARKVASNWNWAREHVPGWPAVRLTRPRMRDNYSIPLDALPASFAEDVERMMERLSGATEWDPFSDDPMTDDPFGDPEAPPMLTRNLRPRTLTNKRWQIRQCVGALVKSGIDPAEIRSLRDLVQPESRAKTILNFLRARAAEQITARGDDVPNGLRTGQLGMIADLLRQIGQFHCRLPANEVARLKHYSVKLTPERRGTMTDENAARLRILVAPHTRRGLLVLPQRLLAEAAKPATTPKSLLRLRRDALLVLHGVAMEILLMCPMRRKNLSELRLDRHLLREAKTGRIIAIHLRPDETKNSESIEWPLPAETADMIDLYVKRYRPLLAEPGNPFLFPGSGQRGREAHAIAVALTEIIKERLGVAFNLHIARHFAAWMYLTRHPGKYEIVRRVLGHKSVETTSRFYTGLETAAAAAHFDDVILDDRKATRRAAAAAAFRPKLKRSSKSRRRS